MCAPCGLRVRGGRFLGGARLGGAGLISRVIEPSLFGHAGYGSITYLGSGPAFDMGFALDVKLVRYFRFGAQGAYNVVSNSAINPTTREEGRAVQWISYGVHVGGSF